MIRLIFHRTHLPALQHPVPPNPRRLKPPSVSGPQQRVVRCSCRYSQHNIYFWISFSTGWLLMFTIGFRSILLMCYLYSDIFTPYRGTTRTSLSLSILHTYSENHSCSQNDWKRRCLSCKWSQERPLFIRLGPAQIYIYSINSCSAPSGSFWPNLGWRLRRVKAATEEAEEFHCGLMAKS